MSEAIPSPVNVSPSAEAPGKRRRRKGQSNGKPTAPSTPSAAKPVKAAKTKEEILSDANVLLHEALAYLQEIGAGVRFQNDGGIAWISMSNAQFVDPASKDTAHNTDIRLK